MHYIDICSIIYLQGFFIFILHTMKKTIWILSLSVLLFSTLAPSFTYATWEVADEPTVETDVSEITNQESLLSGNDNDLWYGDYMFNITDNDSLDNSWDNDSLDVDPTDDFVNSDINDVLSQNVDTLTLNDLSWKSCYDYEYNYTYGTLILKKYLCDDTNIVIPTSESWANKTTSIQDWAFAWKLIESLEMPDQFSVNPEAFSWAIFSWNITLEEKKSWQYFNTLYSITVAEWAVLTLKQANRLYMSTVNWKLIYDLNNLSSANYLLNKWTINWEVEIRWLNWSLNRSFESCNITENWKVLLWEWITKIDESSFGWDSYTDTPSILRWTLVFPSTLKEISSSFHNTQIDSNLIFPKSINKVYYSFRESDINSDFFFESESGESWFNITDSFWYSNIWSLVFSWLNITLRNVSPQAISWDLSFVNSRFTSFRDFLTIWNHIISWDVNFINSDLYLNWWSFFNTSTVVWDFNMSWNSIILSSGIPDSLKIFGDLNITWNNLIMPWFANSEITWNVNINAWTMNLQYWLNGSKIKWDVTIIGDDISAKYWALNGLSISWDFLMSWKNLDLQTDVLNGLKIDWNFEIKWGLLKAYYGVLNGLNVYWDIKLPRNSEFWPGTLWWVIAKWNYIISYDTTVSIWDSVNNAQLSNDVRIVADEIESNDINTDDDKIVVQNSEIVATSWMVVEYEWWLNINFKDNSSSDIEWTARFSAPIAVKVPVKNINNNFVKVMVKHQWDEDFWFTGLTLSQENVCDDWIPTSNPYNWEDVAVEENNGERYAVIYTCSASTFVAYTENEKKNDNNNENNSNSNVSNNTTSSSAWGWSTISVKSNTTVKEQEHNSADTEKTTEKENNSIQPSNKTETTSVEQKVRMVWWKSLTRWEVAVMTNILLDVYPQLTENKTLNEVSEACENYADEQNFTKDEKKAITRLCKLSIMWIHRDTKEPLDEFMVKQMASNDEFATVMDRAVANYTEKDLSVVKEALKKLEWNEENVVFWTVYDVFMSIKNIFG